MGINTAEHASGRALHKTVACKRIKNMNYLEDKEVEGRIIGIGSENAGWESVD